MTRTVDEIMIASDAENFTNRPLRSEGGISGPEALTRMAAHSWNNEQLEATCTHSDPRMHMLAHSVAFDDGINDCAFTLTMIVDLEGSLDERDVIISRGEKILAERARRMIDIYNMGVNVNNSVAAKA